MTISGNTKLYGVIGDPIMHSLSPVFQNQIIRQKNLNAVYLPLRITAQGLQGSMELLKNNFAGFNVTIPYKEKIMDYLDEIDQQALEYGAVNTVKNCGGKLFGYNTDGIGFIKSLQKAKADLAGKEVLLLGAGGAAKVLAFEIIKQGGKLTIANRNTNRAEQLAAELKNHYDVFVKIVEPGELQPDYQIIINSTPVGMYPKINQCPVNVELVQNVELVYDVIYTPLETEMVKLGKQFGAKTINGLPMLIYQGVKSFEIWTGQRVTAEEIAGIQEILKNIQL